MSKYIISIEVLEPVNQFINKIKDVTGDDISKLDALRIIKAITKAVYDFLDFMKYPRIDDTYTGLLFDSSKVFAYALYNSNGIFEYKFSIDSNTKNNIIEDCRYYDSSEEYFEKCVENTLYNLYSMEINNDVLETSIESFSEVIYDIYFYHKDNLTYSIEDVIKDISIEVI